MIATNSKCYNEGDFIKKCLVVCSKILFPENPHITSKFESVSLNRCTITRRIDNILQRCIRSERRCKTGCAI